MLLNDCLDTTVRTKCLNLGYGKLGKVMEKVMGSHGILKSSKSTNPVILQTWSALRSRQYTLKENWELWGTEHVQGQMSQQRFCPKWRLLCLLSSNIFANMCSFENLGNITWIFLSFSWGIITHVTCLDQLCTWQAKIKLITSEVCFGIACDHMSKSTEGFPIFSCCWKKVGGAKQKPEICLCSQVTLRIAKYITSLWTFWVPLIQYVTNGQEGRWIELIHVYMIV